MGMQGRDRESEEEATEADLKHTIPWSAAVNSKVFGLRPVNDREPLTVSKEERHTLGCDCAFVYEKHFHQASNFHHRVLPPTNSVS